MQGEWVGDPLQGMTDSAYSAPQLLKKQKRLFQKGVTMNHPEYSPAIIFDDAAFEIGDMAEVKLVIGECLIGKIHSIDKDVFSVDVSERFHSRVCTYRYSDVEEMKIIEIPH